VITTLPEYFDEHSASLELWSPGNPTFPVPPEEMPSEALDATNIKALLAENNP
jgi:hypothetical protein